MTYKFIINGRLPGMNDFIGAMNANRWKGAKLKKEATTKCALAAAAIPKISNPVNLSISWVERDNRRDIDNVAAGGTKCILDGLVLCGVLKNDGRKWVKGIEHTFPPPEKVYPRIEVLIDEII